MARINKAELASDLTDLLVPGDPVGLYPREVSDELIYTQQLLSGTHKFRTAVLDTLNGGAGVTTVDLPAVPAGNYDYVFSAEVNSNDAVARQASLRIRDNIGNVVNLANTGGVARILGQATGDPVVCPRSFLLPPGWNIEGLVIGLAAGAIVNVRAFRVRHLLLDPHAHF